MKMLRLQRGLTLVELMIAVAIGVLLLFGISLLFTQNRQSYRQNEEMARIQENARYAMSELNRDLAMAGFFAEVVDGSSSVLATNVSAPADAQDCGPGTPWLYDFSNGFLDGAVRIADHTTAPNGTAVQNEFNCIDGATFRAGTDVIGIRRTSGVASFWSAAGGSNSPDCTGLRMPDGTPCVNAVPARGIFVRENGSQAVLYPAWDAPTAPPQPYEDWEYTPRIYYVRDVDVAGDDIPMLCRRRLDNSVATIPQPLVEECIVAGVENLQIELGVDTNGDGAANSYISDPSPAELERAVSVRFYLLMRALQPDVGYSDERQYTLGNVTVPAANDRFHRRVYTATVTMRNLNNIRRLGF